MNEYDNPVQRQVEHRGHTILVSSEKSLGGWLMKYYSVFRESDGYECTSGFSNDEDTLDTWVQILRDRIDAELLEADPWDENAETEGTK